MWKFYLYLMVMWAGSLPLLAAPDLTVVRDRDQTITGNKTFSGALVATNTVSLKGYVVDSFAASLLTATNSADVRSKLGLGGAALLNVGTMSGTVAAGNDSRIVNAVQQSGSASLTALTVSGTITTRSTSGDAMIRTDSPEANYSGFRILKDGKDVWTMAADNATHNSDFLISRFDANGSWLNNPLSISKLDGTMTVGSTKVQGVLTVSNHIELPNDTRRGLAATYGVFNSTFGIEQASSLQTGDGAALRIIGSSWAPEQYIAFGRYTDETTFYEFARFNFSGDLILKQSAAGVVMGSGAKILSGSGSPEGSKTAPVGSLYLRSDGGAGTTLYVKQSGTGNTGWVGK